MDSTAIGEPARKRPPRLQRVAYHEAGHAVAAYIMGVGFHDVFIRPDGTGSFGAHHKPESPVNFSLYGEPDPETRTWVGRQIIVWLAGEQAERLKTGRARLHLPDTFDVLRFTTWVAATPKEALAYVEWLKIRTRTLLKRPDRWAAVEAVAAELLEQREVKFERAREIIQQALGPCCHNCQERPKSF